MTQANEGPALPSCLDSSSSLPASSSVSFFSFVHTHLLPSSPWPVLGQSCWSCWPQESLPLHVLAVQNGDAASPGLPLSCFRASLFVSHMIRWVYSLPSGCSELPADGRRQSSLEGTEETTNQCQEQPGQSLQVKWNGQALGQ